MKSKNKIRLLIIISFLFATNMANAQWQINGNTLTGATPTTPAEWIGSINKYDFIIRTENVERMRVQQGTGNVGIGTTMPVSALNVAGATALTWGATTTGLVTLGTNVTGASLFVNTPGQTGWSSGLGIDGSYLSTVSTINIKAYGTKYTGYSSNLAFSTSNSAALSEAMRISSAGYVGIGTINPQAKLHLNNGSVLCDGTTGATPTGGAGTRMMWIPAKWAFRAGSVTSTQWDAGNIGNYSVAFGNNTKASGDYSTAFGGGTIASGALSTCFGNMNTASGMGSFVNGILSTASGDYSTAFGYGSTAQSYASFVVGQYNIISGTSGSWVSTEPLFVIGNGNNFSSGASNAMTVYKNGKTVIGNPGLSGFTTPGNYLLYVQQGILTEKVRVAIVGTANWADYVFDEKYKLKSINELERFVKANKHLPNVPSAEDVVKNGIDMATMDSKLLEKIEELSLYIIEQNKRIEALENKTNELSK